MGANGGVGNAASVKLKKNPIKKACEKAHAIAICTAKFVRKCLAGVGGCYEGGPGAVCCLRFLLKLKHEGCDRYCRLLPLQLRLPLTSEEK